MATKATKEEQPAEDSGETEVVQHEQQQMVQPETVERKPEDWKEPGWEQGMFPGDPNTYPDPENLPQSY